MLYIEKEMKIFKKAYQISEADEGSGIEVFEADAVYPQKRIIAMGIEWRVISILMVIKSTWSVHTTRMNIIEEDQ